MKLTVLVAALVLAAAGAAHAQGNPTPTKPPAPAATPAMPLVDGEVRKVDLEKGLVVLKHGDLPNIGMPAMTMGFDVADRKMLQDLKVGQKVKFQAAMIRGQATVTELKQVR